MMRAPARDISYVYSTWVMAAANVCVLLWVPDKKFIDQRPEGHQADSFFPLQGSCRYIRGLLRPYC